MRRLYTCLFILAAALPAAAVLSQPSLTFLGPQNDQLVEGKSYEIRWDGLGLKSVTVIASGDRTDYPGRDRGRFNVVIAGAVPASQGEVSWTVPFLDTVEFRLKIKGYDATGRMAVREDHVYTFRPAVLRTRTADGIYIDLRNENRQRLYVLRDNKVIRAYLTSGARTNEFYHRNVHPKKPHDHAGVFHIINKYPVRWSNLYHVNMYWAMRYWGGHFIHGTYPNLYYKLGTAASAGCNRLTKGQAKELYDMTPIGTRVEIIAK